MNQTDNRQAAVLHPVIAFGIGLQRRCGVRWSRQHRDGPWRATGGVRLRGKCRRQCRHDARRGLSIFDRRRRIGCASERCVGSDGRDSESGSTRILSGHYVYVANQGDATVSQYAVGADGVLAALSPAVVADRGAAKCGLHGEHRPQRQVSLCRRLAAGPCRPLGKHCSIRHPERRHAGAACAGLPQFVRACVGNSGDRFYGAVCVPAGRSRRARRTRFRNFPLMLTALCRRSRRPPSRQRRAPLR